MPSIAEKLDMLNGSSIFTTFDLASGYWQIGLSPESKEKTAVVTKFGPMEFNVMPFGLCNAGATFQCYMEKMLFGLNRSTAYIDDILTFSESWKEHLNDLKALLDCLSAAGLKIKTNKCRIDYGETKFLGFIINKGGVSIDKTRIQAIKDYPCPKNQKQLKRFLGLASYYRKFAKDLATTIDALTKLTSKKNIFKWEQIHQEAFDRVKEILTNPPILAYPDFSKTFRLQTDASNTGQGAVLSQLDESGQQKVICYASRTLNEAERRYSTIEQELLAVIWATEQFRIYLYGKKFELETDHRPLT